MSNSRTERFNFTAAPPFSGRRLDLFLTAVAKDFTRARLQKLIRDGHVLVGGRPAKASYVVRIGDEISLVVPPPEVHDVQAQDIPLNILYEDSDIIVVDKPAGMVVHPAAGNWEGTLVNALMAHCGSLSVVGGEIKPGIVHRLDKGTSGVMVAAKNDRAHLSLSRQFKDRQVKKIYQALVYGTPKEDEGTITAAIGRALKDRKKYSTMTKKGREALTQWKVVSRFDNELALLEIRLRTGRTHQIRVHFAAAGHPLVGDMTYGHSGRRAKQLKMKRRQVVGSFPRPALHASRLGFIHPVSGQWMEFEAPLPEDFRDLLKSL